MQTLVKKSVGPTRSRSIVEKLEERKLLSAVTHLATSLPSLASSTVYVESNNPTVGQNAVIAFSRNSANGSLHQIGKFLTGGTGQGNPTQGLGPDDSDQEVVASADGRFLFAVNQGSNSIAVFNILSSGRLSRVGTYKSGSTQPVSLGISGHHLYVVNRGNALQDHVATIAPNLTGFNIFEDGVIEPIAGSTVTLPVGLSPAQALISPGGHFLFADNFAIPGTSPALAQTLDPFHIHPDGTLTGAPSGPVTASATPNVLLGLALNPKKPIIYGGLVGGQGIAVFSYDNFGSVKFVTSVKELGKGPCWITVSADGKYLYASNTGTDSLGVFSLADPLHPAQIQELKLAGPYAPSGARDPQTACFQIALDPSGKSLYVATQDTAATRDFQLGNAVHALTVGADGMLSETNAVFTFTAADVPAAARLQGIAIVARPIVASANPLAVGLGSIFSSTSIVIHESESFPSSSALVDLAGSRPIRN